MQRYQPKWREGGTLVVIAGKWVTKQLVARGGLACGL